MMRWKKKSIIMMTIVSLSLSHTVFASENVSKSALADVSDVYLQALYAAVATLLVVLVLYAIIFRPSIKDPTE